MIACSIHVVVATGEPIVPKKSGRQIARVAKAIDVEPYVLEVVEQQFGISGKVVENI